MCEVLKNTEKNAPVTGNSQESQFLRLIMIMTVRTPAFSRAVHVRVHHAPRSYGPPFCRFPVSSAPCSVPLALTGQLNSALVRTFAFPRAVYVRARRAPRGYGPPSCRFPAS